jgi:hypothetical protein
MVPLDTEAGWIQLLGTVEHSVQLGTELDIELGEADWPEDIELDQQ